VDGGIDVDVNGGIDVDVDGGIDVDVDGARAAQTRCVGRLMSSGRPVEHPTTTKPDQKTGDSFLWFGVCVCVCVCMCMIRV
jgi:hypothetical protein